MSTTISVRVDPQLEAQLAEIAKATDRSKSWHVEQAIKSYLEVQAWQIAHIKKGIEAAEAGNLIPHEQVVASIRKRLGRAGKKRA